MRTTGSLVSILFACVAGCGGGGDDPDAPRTIDSATPDAGVDAGIDAEPASFSGTIAVAEATVSGIPQLGQGVTIDIDFAGNDAVPPVFEEQPGSPLGCKAWEYTPAQAAEPGLDEGTVTLTVGDGAPVFPDCTYLPTRGYLCRGANGVGGTIALVNAPQGLWSYTDDQITDATAEIGRYLNVSGALTAANNGAFPIVAAAPPNTVVFVNPNPAGMPETLPGAATFISIAGAGPIPGTNDPGFLEDDDELTVTLTTGGDGDFETFTRTFTAAGGGVGDDFTLDTASDALIRDIPVDGSAFSLSCEGTGGTCNTAIGGVLTLTTTDAPTAGLPPFVMPPPTTKQVRIRCAVIGSSTVEVTALASAYLMTAGATRIQASFLRANLQTAGNSGPVPADSNIVAGHAIAGYTNP
jgi:hypothetical protein